MEVLLLSVGVWFFVIFVCWLGSCVIMGEWLTVAVFYWEGWVRGVLVLWTVLWILAVVSSLKG